MLNITIRPGKKSEKSIGRDGDVITLKHNKTGEALFLLFTKDGGNVRVTLNDPDKLFSLQLSKKVNIHTFIKLPELYNEEQTTSHES